LTLGRRSDFLARSFIPSHAVLRHQVSVTISFSGQTARVEGDGVDFPSGKLNRAELEEHVPTRHGPCLVHLRHRADARLLAGWGKPRWLQWVGVGGLFVQNIWYFISYGLGS
jgi:hypothetical protein